MDGGIALRKRLPSREGGEEAVGRTFFATDVVLPGMLHGKIWWSTRPHARLLEWVPVREAKGAGHVPAARTLGTLR